MTARPPSEAPLREDAKMGEGAEFPAGGSGEEALLELSAVEAGIAKADGGEQATVRRKDSPR
jgi:hypothetical protein